MTVLTVTPNPSLDRTYTVDHLARGTVLRAATDQVEPGGKGVNVARAVAAAGGRTIAALPLGGPEGALLARLLDGLGIHVAGVPVAGSTRVNVSLAEPDGTLTKINAPGPALTPAEAAHLLDTVTAHAQAHADTSTGPAGTGTGTEGTGTGGHVAGDAETSGAAGGNTPRAAARWIACCGSLPRGLPPTWYADLVARAHTHGARVALDTSGPALAAALPARPDIVKPNADELAEATGRTLTTVGDAVAAARALRDAGARAVLASLGATGQLLLDDTGTYYGHAPVTAVRSDVGAGDASLAGLLTAGGTGPRALAAAVTHGAAAVQLPGSAMPTPRDLRPHTAHVTADLPLDLPLDRPAAPPQHRALPDRADGAVR